MSKAITVLDRCKRLGMILLLAGGVTIAPRLVAHADDFIIGQLEGSAYAAFFEPVLREAYGRLGHNILFKPFPFKRSAVLANIGDLDGDMARAGSFGQDYPNLLKIPVPIFESVMYGVYIRPEISFTSWQDLDGFRVGRLNGMVLVRQRLDGIDSRHYPSIDYMLDNLVSGALDVVVVPAFHLLNYKHANPQTADLFKVVPLERTPLYHFVHKRHASLADQLAAEITAMTNSGRLAEIQDTVKAMKFP